MADSIVSGPSNSSPAAPTSTTPAQTPGQPPRARASDFEVAMEQRNAQVSERRTAAIADSDRRSREQTHAPQPDQRERGVDGLEAFGLENPSELDDVVASNEPEKPEVKPDGDELADEPSKVALRQEDAALLAAAKEWLESGSMPERFMNTPIEWVDKGTGILRRQTIAELQEGNMRQGEFSSRMNSLRQIHQGVQQKEQLQNQFWLDVKTPTRLLEEFEDRGPEYEKAFEEAAVLFSQRRMRMKALADAARMEHAQRSGLPPTHAQCEQAWRDTMGGLIQAQRHEAENRRLKQHNAFLQSQQQQQQQQQVRQVSLQQLHKSLEPIIPVALKAYGVRLNQDNQIAFMRHLNAYVSSLPQWDGNVRRRDAMKVAQMVREELEDRAAIRQAKPAQRRSQSMGGSQMSQSGSARPVVAQNKRPSEFDDHTAALSR